MDVYVVLDGSTFVGVSARLQGAEVLRSDWARKQALATFPDVYVAPEWAANRRENRERFERVVYERQQIINSELQDAE